LYEHGLIKSLVQDPKKKIDPSYIPSRTFALALLDTLARQGGTSSNPGHAVTPTPAGDGAAPPSVALVRRGLAQAESPDLARSLTTLIAEAGEDLKALQAGVERWFNDTMERAGGWYRRKVQLILTTLAVIVTVSLNADTLMMGNALLRDATLRAAVVAAADQYTETASVDSLKVQFASLQLPIGWAIEADSPAPKDPIWWLTKLIGLAITALAISLGAPFWFDVLNKVAKIRSTGPKPAPPAEPKPAEAAS
jgi:hypothetical protein